MSGKEKELREQQNIARNERQKRRLERKEKQIITLVTPNPIYNSTPSPRNKEEPTPSN